MISYIVGMTLGSIFLLIGFIILLINFKNSRDTKKLIKKIGIKAEKRINKLIAVWSNHTKNKFISLALYKYGHNKFFEIDSILITEKVLVCIEIKSVKGLVQGSANDDVWKKIRGNNKYSITNAIKQNDLHLMHLSEILKLKVPMISLIIYSNTTDQINILDTPEHTLIIKEHELFQKLDELNNSLKVKIPRVQMKNIYNIIQKHKVKKKSDRNTYKKIISQRR